MNYRSTVRVSIYRCFSPAIPARLQKVDSDGGRCISGGPGCSPGDGDDENILCRCGSQWDRDHGGRSPGKGTSSPPLAVPFSSDTTRPHTTLLTPRVLTHTTSSHHPPRTPMAPASDARDVNADHTTRQRTRDALAGTGGGRTCSSHATALPRCQQRAYFHLRAPRRFNLGAN